MQILERYRMPERKIKDWINNNEEKTWGMLYFPDATTEQTTSIYGKKQEKTYKVATYMFTFDTNRDNLFLESMQLCWTKKYKIRETEQLDIYTTAYFDTKGNIFYIKNKEALSDKTEQQQILKLIRNYFEPHATKETELEKKALYIEQTKNLFNPSEEPNTLVLC